MRSLAVSLTLAAAAFSVGASHAAGQSYPVRPVRKQGATVQPETPAAFAQYIREERNRIAGLAKSAGIRID